MQSNDDSTLNLLVAYPYANAENIKLLKRHEDCVRFILDSGAFTAWKAGKSIALDDYCRFIEQLPIKPWKYFTLDVIGDPEKSFENYELMRRRGFTPIPIFTRGEQISGLDEYYKTSEVVGIGGLVGTRGGRSFVNGIMRHVGNRKVHWLGYTSLLYIKAYKPFMCDTSSWELGRYAGVSFYAGNGKQTPVRNKIELLKEKPKWLIDLLQKFAVDKKRLFIADAKLRNRAWVEMGAASTVLKSLDVKKHCGTNLFIAIVDHKQISLMVDKFRALSR